MYWLFTISTVRYDDWIRNYTRSLQIFSTRYLICVGLMDGDVIVYDISISSGKAVFINSSYTCKHLGCVWQVCKFNNQEFFRHSDVIYRFNGVLHRMIIILDFVRWEVMVKWFDGHVLKENWDKWFYWLYQVQQNQHDWMMVLFWLCQVLIFEFEFQRFEIIEQVLPLHSISIGIIKIYFLLEPKMARFIKRLWMIRE